MNLQFGLQAYTLPSLPAAAQRMVNCYMETAPQGAQSAITVMGSYGVRNWTTCGTGPLRGAMERNGAFYVVSGTSLYSVDALGASTTLGTVAGSGYVAMAADETNIMMVTGGVGYYYDGASVAQITDVDFPAPTNWVECIDGYFTIQSAASGRFYVSTNRSPSTWAALDFATAEKYPDDLVSGIVDHGELILFGRRSGEVWYDSGNTDFPLDRTASGVFEVGALCPRGPAKLDNTVFFPGHDKIIYRLDGYNPQRISTHAIEKALERSTNDNYTGIAWKEGGHGFYALSSSDHTYVFDVATQLWMQRESYGYDSWRWAFCVLVNGEWIVGDKYSNKLGKLNGDTFTEWGETMSMVTTSATLQNERQRLTHNRLEIVTDNGVGLVTGQGSDPQLMMRFSDDDGRTWSNERWRTMGQIGAYKSRAVFNCLGQSRSRIYEATITDPVRRAIISANVDIEANGK